MSDEPTFRVTRTGPWRNFAEPAGAKHCPICDCSEPENPAYHASTCPRYEPPQQIPGQTSFEELP